MGERLAASRPVRLEPALLLERDAELAALDAALEGLQDGAGGIVAVEGPAGIGKSSLLGHVRRRAGGLGLRLLTARGSELERSFPFGVVRQLLEPAVARAAPEERAAALAGAAALAAPLLDPGRAADPAAGEDGAFAVLHGLYWLCANLAEEAPLVLAVDDLHWADAASLRWLSFLAHRLDGLPVLVVGTLRPLDTDAEPALADLLADPVTVTVQPAPLTAEATAALVGARLGADGLDDLAAACHEASGGNPLLLRELVGALARGDAAPEPAEVRRVAPEVVARRVRLELARLGAPATALARAVAVLGEDADLRQAAALAGVGDEDAAHAVTLLARAEVLEAGRPLRFVHPLIRRAVYDAFPGAQRDAVHAAAARLLLADGAAPERVAAQLLLAPPAGRPDAVEALRAAARRALAEGAAESAVAFLRRALDEPPGGGARAAVLLELAGAEARVGAPETSARLREALPLLDDGAQRARARLELARSLFWRAQEEAAVAEVEAALEEAQDADPAVRRTLEAECLSAALRVPGRHADAIARVRAAYVGDADDAGARALLALRAYVAAFLGEDRDRAVTLAERALAGGMPRDEAPGWSLWGAVSALLVADRFATALGVVDEAVADARRRGAVYLFSGSVLVRAMVLEAQGALLEAEADARAAVEALPHRGATLMPMAFGTLALVLVERGALDEAGETLAAAGADGPLPAAFGVVSLLRARGLLRLARGDARGALDDADAIARATAAVGFVNPAAAHWRPVAVAALLAEGDVARARALAHEELELARRWGAPRAVGRALRTAGLAAGGEEALERLRAAVDVLEGSGARLEQVRALADLGAALRRAGRRTEARAPLREALELARRCGAEPLAERAHEELLASGARPRSTALSGVAALTPSERRVAAMAAEGMTNAQIAQALFVIPRTVEMHLSAAFRKLDIASRSQLPAALAGTAR